MADSATRKGLCFIIVLPSSLGERAISANRAIADN